MYRSPTYPATDLRAQALRRRWCGGPRPLLTQCRRPRREIMKSHNFPVKIRERLDFFIRFVHVLKFSMQLHGFPPRGNVQQRRRLEQDGPRRAPRSAP